MLIGVGGPTPANGKAEWDCRGLELIIRPVLSETPFNLMSMHTVCVLNKLCFVWLGELGFPPYILLPGLKRAVVLKIEGGVPVYRQNDPDFKPEKVVTYLGFQVPVSFLGGAAIANMAIACPSVHQDNRQDGDQPAVDGVDSIQPGGEGEGGAGSSLPQIGRAHV